jgi:transposase
MSQRQVKRRKPERQPGRREVDVEELRAILARARRSVLSSEDAETLSAAVETLAFITQELEQTGVTVRRLRKLLFGSSSEKTKDVVGGDGGPAALNGDVAAASEGERGADASTCQDTGEGSGGKRRQGHGRNGATDYTGANKVTIAHASLMHGDRCPGCEKGKVYRQKKPAVLLRVQGVAPLQATVYELERLRCNLCGEVFTAKAPEGIGERKYDETAAAMIALLKYGCGLPFNRLKRLGANLGIPLPSATQWGVVEQAAEGFEPLWAELIHQAAGGDVLYIDDTKAKVLALNEQIQKELAAGLTDRTGVFTSGVVSTVGEREIVLFFTGRDHAGENLEKVLKQRSEGLFPPIQMCDALSRNTSPGDFDTVVANCMAHARRHFVDVVHAFPDEVAHVLEALRDVYRNDAETRAKGMSPAQRMRYHQKHSAPLLEELERWLQAQFDERKIEPNSTLGDAIRYMQNHWDELTLFLRVPGAPLDNNVCERALKRAILHRKNSLFYKTANGAHVGDVFMSLIHTAELCGANPFDYLTAAQRHSETVARQPEQWMPWNYAEALAHTDP